MNKYSLSKTIQKGGLPIALVILVNIALAIAKNNGIDIDPTTVWTIAGAGYGAIVALINWLKNRSKGQPPQPKKE